MRSSHRSTIQEAGFFLISRIGCQKLGVRSAVTQRRLWILWLTPDAIIQKKGNKSLAIQAHPGT